MPELEEQTFVIPTLPEIIIPNIPPFPNVDIEPDINLPPILFPCFDFPNIGPISIPSIIIFEPNIDIPSIIGGFELPSIVIDFPEINFPSITVDFPSVVVVTDDIPISFPVIDDIPISLPVLDDIPDIIVVDSNIPDFIFTLDDIPETVVTTDDIPDNIFVLDEVPENIFVTDTIPEIIFTLDDIPENIFVVDDIPDTITVQDDIPETIIVTFPEPPCIPVCWGTPPTIPVTVTVACPSSSPSSTSMTDMNMREMLAKNATGGESMFMSPDDIEVSYDISGFPSEIKILPPDDIIIKHDIPKEIDIKGFKFDPIEFNVPKLPSIKLEMPDTPLKIETIGMPDKLMLEVSDDFPRFIQFSMPIEMPTVKIDASSMPTTITVVGMPATISIDPIQIELKVPDFIPLSYVGDPIPVSVSVQLELNLNKMLLDNAENLNCVALIPCPR